MEKKKKYITSLVVVSFMLIGITSIYFLIFKLPNFSIKDTKKIYDSVLQLPILFNLKNTDSVILLKTPDHLDISTQFVYSSNWKEVHVKIPNIILNLNPREIYINSHIVILQLKGGGPGTHHGICIFLNENVCTIPNFINQYDLKPIDEKYHIYQYALYDYRVLLQACKK